MVYSGKIIIFISFFYKLPRIKIRKNKSKIYLWQYSAFLLKYNMEIKKVNAGVFRQLTLFSSSLGIERAGNFSFYLMEWILKEYLNSLVWRTNWHVILNCYRYGQEDLRSLVLTNISGKVSEGLSIWCIYLCMYDSISKISRPSTLISHQKQCGSNKSITLRVGRN